ncbi:MAG: helix-turn-helix domain-containing protein [Desulfobacteraceae bacterium]|jgi:DNA-binding HxlR family transcriptional regulator
MVQKKTHMEHSGCPVACALDIVGDHWTLLVIRDLMFLGIHEYKEMLAGAEGISSNILTDRLKRLEGNGLIASVPHPQSRKRKLYYLTAKGKDLIHTMVHLIRWSEKHLSDRLEIPPEKKDLLVNGPDRFVALTLQQLARWEKENLDPRQAKRS